MGPVGGGFPTVVVVVVVVDDDDDDAVLVADGIVELDAPRALRRAWFVEAWPDVPATSTPTRLADDLCVRLPGFVFVGEPPAFALPALLPPLSPLAHAPEASGARDAMFWSICA